MISNNNNDYSTPVQRIPRYELLLRELCQYTEKDHPDFRLLRQASRDVSSVAKY
jgi:hypothetical protein